MCSEKCNVSLAPIGFIEGRAELPTAHATDEHIHCVSVEHYRAKFSVRATQIETTSAPETRFVFACKVHERWLSYLVILGVERANVDLEWLSAPANQGGSLLLNFMCAGKTVRCSDQDFNRFLDNWEDWSTLQHEI